MALFWLSVARRFFFFPQTCCLKVTQLNPRFGIFSFQKISIEHFGQYNCFIIPFQFLSTMKAFWFKTLLLMFLPLVHIIVSICAKKRKKFYCNDIAKVITILKDFPLCAVLIVRLQLKQTHSKTIWN